MTATVSRVRYPLYRADALVVAGAFMDAGIFFDIMAVPEHDSFLVSVRPEDHPAAQEIVIAALEA